MLSYIEYLEQHMGLPALIVTTLFVLFFIIQAIGEILELKGKIVPEFMKIRKFFQRKKQEKLETNKTIRDVKELLAEVNAHYSKDNISKRNDWMNWVNSRAEVYDQTIVEITKSMTVVTESLNANTRMTEELFIQSSRDRILDFAAKASNEETFLSREEFKRIFKVYDEYELFLEKRGKTNGEIEIAHRMINDAYALRLKNASFVEDVRGYK